MQISEFFVYVIFIGSGAALFMDVYAFTVKKLLGIQSLNYALVGRWLLLALHGNISQQSIFTRPEQRGETLTGWLMHFLTGAVFAAVFAGWTGTEWMARPQILPAVFMGAATVIFPFFLMQPCLGFGIAARTLPKPGIARIKSLIAHLVFGAGLYFSARLYLFAQQLA